MKRILTLLLVAFCFSAVAQCEADHLVEASSFMFAPSVLTIEQGESVAFVNLGGTHDVNGYDDSQTGESFGNPEAFYLNAVSGHPDGECIGVYTFNIPGTYNYDCSIGNHAALGMVGTIVVNPASGCTDSSAANYDPNATLSGECIYCDPGTFILNIDMFDGAGDGWSGAAYFLYNSAGNLDHSGSIGSAFVGDGLSIGSDYVCVAPGCYSFQVTEDSNLEEVSIALSDSFGTAYMTVGAGQEYGLDFTLTGQCGFAGCTDPGANNYDPSSTIDDGSCMIPPFNESWWDATAIACGLEFDGTLLFANNDEGDIEGGFDVQYDAEASVWYHLNADADYWAVASTCNSQVELNENGLISPTHIEVFRINYDGNLTSIVTEQLTCSGLHSKHAWHTDVGVDYFIRVSSELNESFSVSLECVASIEGCTDPSQCTFVATALVDDGSCQTCGCSDEQALNFDATADLDDGSCVYPGCTYQVACNYDTEATIDDGSCIYAMEECQTCSGQSDGTGFVVWSDVDGDGICDFNEVEGCTNSGACNFLESATDDDGSCEYDSCAGCTDELACNYNADADLDDGSCEYESCAGCMDESACNYDPEATLPGECDLESCFGCTDWYACNYSPPSEYDDGSCEYESCAGCTDPWACNYGVEVTIEDGSCEYESCAGCMDESACNYDAWAILDNGLCFMFDECGVCGGSGIPEDDCDCYGNQLDALGVCGGGCASDFNANGLCDEFEGCGYLGLDFWLDEPFGLYSEALSQGQPIELFVGDYFEVPLLINVPAVFVDEVTETAFQVFQWADISVQGLPPGVDLLFDDQIAGATQACFSLVGGDFPIEEGFWEVTIEGEMFLNVFGSPFGIGPLALSFGVQVQPNPNGVGGCTYPQASNFMPWATFDVGVCVFEGCTDPEALNYDTTFDLDDGSCIYSDPDCGSEPACAEDLNGDGAVGTPDLLQMLAEFGNECE